MLVVLLIPAGAMAQDWGEVSEATVNLNVRKEPAPGSAHVVTLTKGQRVRTDFPQNGWVAVFELDEKERDLSKAIGYANAKYFKTVQVKKAEPTPAAAPQQDSGEGEVKAPVAETPPPASVPVSVDPSRAPVKITSDRMTYDEAGKVISFEGNVVAVHGELTLWADKLSAYLLADGQRKFSADSVERIVAEGSVRAKKGNTEGTCGRLTYLVGPQLLKMEQNPKLQDGPNSLTGEVINFHIKDDRSEVIGGEQRVKAIFMTPGNMKVQ
ncbi:lipopolysaccharide transport periplasmic protein LptA [Pseudodesulfovibrio thermohalotolerans]|uniref:lipopolysaccharide transport periplasmic protein LptA n=1 Tax=Pseudodesulfovibrio thermohalotolerans TaxID=2880651 RepID=UPI0024427C0E|nr:lipopolysaccharide transport periplasmic protein LptA [Pseudodesulfovibrio thermohalotolerans]WFS60986.1 lipopolysaccharide transport periplasmic protein LptA [Pseudodesulfovibrio thermohalotolerans]